LCFGVGERVHTYNWADEHIRRLLVATPTYINPDRGAFFLAVAGREKVTINVAIAAALVILAVVSVTRDGAK